MAAVKVNGLGWTTLSVDDSAGSVKTIINDVTNLSFGTPRGVQDVTGIDKSAYERLLLLADFSITLNGVADFQTGQAHQTLKTVPSTSVLRTVTLVVGAQTLANETLFTDYALTRGADGALTWTAPGVLGDGSVPTWA